MLFKSPPQAPSALITDHWRSHFVGARSSCIADPENQDGIGLPRIRSDFPLASGMTSKSCFEAVPAPQPHHLHRQSPCSMTTAQPSCDQSHHAGEQSTAGKQAASAPEAQPPHHGAGRHVHTTLLGLQPLKTVLRAPRKFVFNDTCIGTPGEVPPGS